jgi:hypothetical protein
VNGDALICLVHVVLDPSFYVEMGIVILAILQKNTLSQLISETWSPFSNQPQQTGTTDYTNYACVWCHHQHDKH